MQPDPAAGPLSAPVPPFSRYNGTKLRVLSHRAVVPGNTAGPEAGLKSDALITTRARCPDDAQLNAENALPVRACVDVIARGEAWDPALSQAETSGAILVGPPLGGPPLSGRHRRKVL